MRSLAREQDRQPSLAERKKVWCQKVKAGAPVLYWIKRLAIFCQAAALVADASLTLDRDERPLKVLEPMKRH